LGDIVSSENAEPIGVGYRCYWLDLNGHIVARSDLAATNDKSATYEAQISLAGSAYSAAELWCLDRMVCFLSIVDQQAP
jgi:uncharacterized protein YcfL